MNCIHEMSYTVPDRTTVGHCTQRVIYSLRALRLYFPLHVITSNMLTTQSTTIHHV